jgi:hypothetical protein
MLWCFVPQFFFKINKTKHFNKNTVHGIEYLKTRWSFELWRQQKMHLNSQSPREPNSNRHWSVFGGAINWVV